MIKIILELLGAVLNASISVVRMITGVLNFFTQFLAGSGPVLGYTLELAGLVVLIAILNGKVGKERVVDTVKLLILRDDND